MIFIEKKGVRTLAEKIETTNSMVIYPSENDKGPIWDGYITIYEFNNLPNRNLKNNEIVGRFSIQIKTRTLKKYSNQISISKDDMENFAKEIGTMYYYVQFVNDIPKVYYYRLLNSDAKRLLSKMTNSKYKRIKFDLLPDDAREIYNIHYDFYHEITRQSIANPTVDIEKIFNEKKSVELEIDIPNDYSYKNYTSFCKMLGIRKPYVYFKDGNKTLPMCRIFDDINLILIKKNGKLL